ncbi:MAG: hypothetical protein R6X12_03905 [bacterium]
MNDGGCLAVSPHSSNIVFCVGNLYLNSRYYFVVSRTADGSTWSRDTFETASNGWAIAFDPTDSLRVYVAGDSNYSYPALFVTTDLGQTWTSSRGGLAGKVWTIATVPGSGELVYVGTSNGVFKSTNAGASWSGTGFTTQTRALAVDPDDPNTVYAGTYGQGVSVTTDGGATWNPMNSGLENLKILSLAMRGGAEPVLFAGTEGGSVYRTGVVTGVVDRPVASRAGLLPATIVRGALRLPGAERAQMLDAAGRKVRELEPGVNDLAGLSPGVYFVRVGEGAGRRIARVTVLD